MKNHIIVTTINDNRSGKTFVCVADLLLMLYKELTRTSKGGEVYLYIEDFIYRLENMKDPKGI
jgi:hypothetical protein